MLKEIRGTILQHLGYHHSNMVASQLKDTLTLRSYVMLSMMQQAFQWQTLPSDTSEEKAGPTNHQANAATYDNVKH